MVVENEWEDVESPKIGDYLERIEVPGSWLYRCWMLTQDGQPTLAMTFVPKPEEEIT
jgi:hypothetical protein